MAFEGTKEKQRSRVAAAIRLEIRKEESLRFAVHQPGKYKRPPETSTKRVIRLARFVAGVPHFRVEGVVLQVFKGAPVKLLAAALGGNGDVAQLCELRVVVELSHFEFTDQLSGRI